MKTINSVRIIVLLLSAAVASVAQTDMTKMPLLYEVGGRENVRVQKDIVYKKAGDVELKMDVYAPAGEKELRPAIIFISGSGETKDWRIFQDYGAVTAAQGMIAIQFNRRFANASEMPQAREDTRDLLEFVRKNADRYGIDRDRIGLWVFSGGGYFADLGMREDQTFIRFIIAFYGIDRVETLEQVRLLGEKLPPFYLVRAGRDNPNLNNAITLFVLQAIQRNLPLTFVNYTDGRHAFDILDDTEETRRIIGNAFGFAGERFAVQKRE
jgi:predicted peptidase